MQADSLSSETLGKLLIPDGSIFVEGGGWPPLTTFGWGLATSEKAMCDLGVSFGSCSISQPGDWVQSKGPLVMLQNEAPIKTLDLKAQVSTLAGSTPCVLSYIDARRAVCPQDNRNFTFNSLSDSALSISPSC